VDNSSGGVTDRALLAADEAAAAVDKDSGVDGHGSGVRS
jgi:hypothetical protein